MTRARFGKFISATVALFILLSVLVYCLQRPSRERLRIAVLPIHDVYLNEETSWLSWHIAMEAGSRLRRGLTKDYLVYPLTWIRQSVDPDSLADIAYLQSFSDRIGLNFAVLASMSAEAETVRLDYLFVRVTSPSIIKKSQILVPILQATDIGRLLAQEVVHCLNQYPVMVADASPDLTVARLHSEVEEQLALAEYDKAVQVAESAFLMDSVSVHSRNLLAASLLQASVVKEKNGQQEAFNRLRALRICENSILVHHNADAVTYRLLGNYYLIEKLWGNAERHLQKAIEMDPEDAEAFSLFAYLNDNRFKNVGFKNDESLLRHVLFLNPCDENARLRLAELYFSRNYQKKACEEIQALLAIHPRSIDGLMFLGKLGATRNDFVEVMRIYDKIFQIEPRNADAYYNLGIYYYQAEDLENAEKLFNRAVRLNNHLDSHLYLGQIYERQHKPDKAVEEYRLRVRYNKGFEDRFADVARSRLFELLKPDSTILKSYVR
jgi:tetratricopeptide (TPR) repeat protein